MATLTFGRIKSENEQLVMAAVAAACKALAKKQNTLRFMEQEFICSANDVHDLGLRQVAKQAVFTLRFASSKGVCLLSVRPCNTTFHPEQAGMYWAKFQAPKSDAKLLGVFDSKGKKVGECVKFVPEKAMPFAVDVDEAAGAA